jgi:Flavodoxin-like fold
MASVAVRQRNGPAGQARQRTEQRLEAILYPIHRGIFEFTGLTVIEPLVIYGPNRIEATARAAALRRYGDRMLSLDTAPTLPSLDMTDFDAIFRLNRNAAEHPWKT